MLPVYLLKTLVSPEPLALNPPSPSSAQPAPAAPSSVLAGPASLGWPGGTVWAGMGDLGWGGAELGLCQSQPVTGFQLAVDPKEGGGQLSLCLLLLCAQLAAGAQL
jgi:hypothetical protein